MLNRLVSILALTALLPAATLAQDAPYPAKPLRVVVPYAAGGATTSLRAPSASACPSRSARPSWWTTSPVPQAAWVHRRWRAQNPMATPCC